MLRVHDGQPRTIPDPLIPGFSESAFYDAFMAHGDGSPEDLNIYNFGALVASRVERIFMTLEQMERECRRFTYDEVAEAVVVFLHRTQVQVFSDYQAALEEITTISREALQGLRTSVDEHGSRFTAQEILQAAVDGARHVLKHARGNKGFGGKGSERGIDDLQAVLPIVLRLGSQFESLRSQWNSVLWGEARVYVDVRPPYQYHIDKYVSRREFLASVDLARRESVIARDADEMKGQARVGEALARKVIMRDRKGPGCSPLTVLSAGAMPPELREIAIQLAVAHSTLLDRQVEFFLNATHESLKGMTYRKVLDAWYCLTLLALIDWHSAHEDPTQVENTSIAQLTRISINELVNAMSLVLEVPPADAKTILNFLTYQGGHQTLWSRPLLVTSDFVLPLWWPLQAGHLMRLVDSWGGAKGSKGAQYSDKGHEYEDLIGDLLHRLSRYRNVSIPFTALGPRLAIKEIAEDGNEVGDVDAAFIVEKTLFILECRSVGYPAEAYEFWSVNDALEDKIRQVTRKKNYIAKNPEVVVSWARKLQIDLPIEPIERVVSVVVSNSFLLEGERKEEPYFVHLDTLFNLLLTGKSIFGGGLDQNNQEVEFHVDFQMQSVSVADAIIQALQSPAKAEAYKASVVPFEVKIPPFDHTDATGFVRSPAVELPSALAEIEALLRRCSFSPYISHVTVGR